MRTREDILRFVQGDPRLRAAWARATAEDHGDAAHDVEHLLRVALWTVRIGGAEVDPAEAVAAALLHDVVNVPKDSPHRARASALCAEEARRVLGAAGFGDEAVARMADAIEDHSYSRGATPRSPLGQALQDADRLEALGALGIMRTFSTGARMGARYSHPEDPWARARALDDVAFSVDHFFKKLLGLSATMCTAAGRAEGERRTAHMRAFLEQLAEELGAPLPPA